MLPWRKTAGAVRIAPVYAFPQLKLGVSDIAVRVYVSQYTNLPELDWKSASEESCRAPLSGGTLTGARCLAGVTLFPNICQLHEGY
jgi:hypothetical protein